MKISPDEMLNVLTEAYKMSKADYDAAIAQGVPSWLLAKPEQPTINSVMVTYGAPHRQRDRRRNKAKRL